MTNTIKCLNCGFENEKENNFCINCGSNLHEEKNNHIDDKTKNRFVGAGTGAVIGTLVAGPLGAVVGGYFGDVLVRNYDNDSVKENFKQYEEKSKNFIDNLGKNFNSKEDKEKTEIKVDYPEINDYADILDKKEKLDRILLDRGIITQEDYDKI